MTASKPYRQYTFPAIDAGGGAESADDADALEHQIRSAEAEGYRQGFEQGRDENLAAELARVQPWIDLLNKAAAAVESHQGGLEVSVRADAARLSLKMTEAILEHETQNRPQRVGDVARVALRMAEGQGHILIKANPEDCETIRSLLHEMTAQSDLSEEVAVIADQAIRRSGCLVETDFGSIDARIDKQLAAVAHGLNTAAQKSGRWSPDAPPGSIFTPIMNDIVRKSSVIKACGHVTKVIGLVLEANGPMVQLGSLCDIGGSENEPSIKAEVLGFRDQTVLMMPLEDVRSIRPGSRVVSRPEKASVAVGNKLLGRVIDGLGNPIDGGGALVLESEYPVYGSPINPLLRQRIRTPLDLGVRAINGLLTVGCGQRMGIFAGSGVGKSVLMGMIARKSRADVNVIALIGERGRELNEFIDKDLGPDGLQKSVVVVATSDNLPLVRVRGAFVATAIAEYFRDQGLHVNLMMDSLTRFAMAQREIGLALGEPPTTKGYTPSVFTLLPKLLERAGTSDHNGTITGLYTVLVEGDDMNEPIADAARSILDGHIVLSRDLAAQNHYPAIDVLRSISRVMDDISTLQHKHNAGRFKELLATFRKAEDLINIGAYVTGSNPAIDRAIAKIDAINGYLRQEMNESIGMEESLQQLERIMNAP